MAETYLGLEHGFRYELAISECISLNGFDFRPVDVSKVLDIIEDNSADFHNRLTVAMDEAK